MKKIGIFILLILVSLNVVGQDNYQEAELELTTGEILHLKVDDRKWMKVFDFINTKDENDQIKKYTAHEVSRLKIKEDEYIGGAIEFELSTLNSEYLDTSKHYILEKDTCFLRVLHRSKVVLCVQTNRLGIKNFYIQKDGGKIELLKFKKYYWKAKDEKRYLKKKTKFHDQLIVLFGNNYETTIRKIHYRENELKKFFDEHFESNLRVNNKKAKTNFGIIGGVSKTNIKFSGDKYGYLTKMNFKIDPKILLGIYLETVFLRDLGKYSWYNELSYVSYEGTAEYLDYKSESHFWNYSATVSNSYVGWTSSFRCMGNLKGDLNFYVSPGISLLLAINGGSSYNEVLSSNGYTDVSNGSIHEVSKYMMFNGVMDLGVKYKSFTGGYRFTIARGSSIPRGMSVMTSRHHLYAAIKLSK